MSGFTQPKKYALTDYKRRSIIDNWAKNRKQKEEMMSKPTESVPRPPSTLVKRIQPLMIARQEWSEQMKEAKKQLDEVNQAIEVLMIQARVKTVEVLDHRITNASGTNISCKWDLLRQRLLDLTEDVDLTEDIINEVRSRTEYTYIRVDPIKAGKDAGAPSER